MLGRISLVGALVACLAVLAAEKAPHASRPPEAATRHVKLLAVPHLQQETMLCVPTSAAMILAYYGDPQSPRLLKTLSAGKSYSPSAPFNDFTGTWYRDQLRGLQQLGYVWSEVLFADTEEGFSAALEVIDREIKLDHPVMIDFSFKAGQGHSVVVVGIDPVARQIFYLDPGRPAPGRVILGYDELARIWNEHAYDHRFRSVVITQPRTIGSA